MNYSDYKEAETGDCQMRAFLGRYSQLIFIAQTNATGKRRHRCHRWGVEGTDGRGVLLGAS